MAESDEGFLSRWARRKAEITEDEAAPQPAEAEAPGATPVDDGKSDAEREAELVASLPDIDSLDESSDFSQFMQKGVPAALQRRALRKLWRVNPVFSFLDGMNEYDEDFTLATSALTEVKTIYQVGKGMVPRDEEAAEEAGEEAGAEAETEAEAAEGETAQVADAEPAVADDDGGESEDVVEAEALTAEQGAESLPFLPEEPAVAPAEPEVAEAAPVGSGRSAARRRWGAFEV